MKQYLINILLIFFLLLISTSNLFAEGYDKIYFDKYWLVDGYGAEIWFVYVETNTHKLKRHLLYLETEPITEIYIIKDKPGYFEKTKLYNQDVLIKIYLPEETQSNKTLISE